MSREIFIYSPGKMKEAYLKTGVEKYLKLIKSDFKINVFFPEIKLSSSTPQKAIEEEARAFLNWADKRRWGWFCVLDERGKELDSFSFSKLLWDKIELSYPVLFYIGGPYGISEEIKKKADFLLSLSRMTFLHEMARLLLLEQIYRAIQIRKGTPYHK